MLKGEKTAIVNSIFYISESLACPDYLLAETHQVAKRSGEEMYELRVREYDKYQKAVDYMQFVEYVTVCYISPGITLENEYALSPWVEGQIIVKRVGSRNNRTAQSQTYLYQQPYVNVFIL